MQVAESFAEAFERTLSVPDIERAVASLKRLFYKKKSITHIAVIDSRIIYIIVRDLYGQLLRRRRSKKLIERDGKLVSAWYTTILTAVSEFVQSLSRSRAVQGQQYTGARFKGNPKRLPGTQIPLEWSE